MRASRRSELTPGTVQIYAAVDGQAGNNWHDYAFANEVSVGGLLEAIAPYLAEAANTVLMDVVVADARRIDAENRRRLMRSGMPRTDAPE